MSVTFPEVRVGKAVCHEALSVFPLFAGEASPVKYLLSDEGIASGAVAVQEISQAARGAGFQDPAKKSGGKKWIFINKDKSVALAVLGSTPLDAGVRIVVSHIDSPRIDLKQNPLYEEADMALLRTHYYGGIKKYQWVTIPLSLHGLVVKPDARILRVRIGEDADDPVFVINDLLPHLSGKTQDQKKLAEAIEGRAPLHGDTEVGHVAELDGVVRPCEHRLAGVDAHLVGIDVEGGDELDVADVVAAELDVHQTGHPLGRVRVLVELDALQQRARAVADAGDGQSDGGVTHEVVPSMAEPFSSAMRRSSQARSDDNVASSRSRNVRK